MQYKVGSPVEGMFRIDDVTSSFKDVISIGLTCVWTNVHMD